MAERVSLFAWGDAEESRSLEAYVAPADDAPLHVRAGDLVLEGYDRGPRVEEAWGDSDYEYWMVVPREHKDAVLLFLLSQWFARGGAVPPTSSDLRAALSHRGIPVAFSSW